MALAVLVEELRLAEPSDEASGPQIPKVEGRRVNGFSEMRLCELKRRALVAVSNSASILD